MAITNSVFDFLQSNSKLITKKNILMIGRQSNYLTQNYIKQYFNTTKVDSHSEFIWKYFKCNKIESVDFSDYEKPTFTHDMNVKIDNKYHNTFDVIYDGGSTEHVFNVPIAFSNYMSMLKKGGTYIGVLPGNNLCNHGFYQFSPDFFYRLFSLENGFKTKVFVKIKNKWYLIKDLKDFDSPIHFNLSFGNKEALLYIISEKIEESNSDYIPLQTIYSSWLWDDKKNNNETFNQTKLFHLLNKITPQFIKTKIWNYKNHKLILQNIHLPKF